MGSLGLTSVWGGYIFVEDKYFVWYHLALTQIDRILYCGLE